MIEQLEEMKSDMKHIAGEVIYLQSSPREGAFLRMRRWEKIGRRMLDLMVNLEKVINGYDALHNMLCRQDSVLEKRGKKWSDEDDNTLIDLMCDENVSLVESAILLGRTIPSILTRTSYLVGVERVSKSIAGRFTGRINGIYTTAEIDGVVTKGEGL